MAQPTVTFSAFCQHCGEEVKPCVKCEKHSDTSPCGSSSFVCFSCQRSSEWQDEAKNMTSEELSDALEEVDYDRRKHCVRLRGHTWSEEDQVMHDNMDKWALILWNEIRRRATNKVKLNSEGLKQ